MADFSVILDRFFIALTERLKKMPSSIKADCGTSVELSKVGYVHMEKGPSPKAIVVTDDGTFLTCTGINAVEAAMAFKPSLLEGSTDFKWAKNMWIFHNMVGHPLMQILALFGKVELAMKVHDITIPRPELTDGDD